MRTSGTWNGQNRCCSRILPEQWTSLEATPVAQLSSDDDCFIVSVCSDQDNHLQHGLHALRCWLYLSSNWHSCWTGQLRFTSFNPFAKSYKSPVIHVAKMIPLWCLWACIALTIPLAEANFSALTSPKPVDRDDRNEEPSTIFRQLTRTSFCEFSFTAVSRARGRMGVLNGLFI